MRPGQPPRLRDDHLAHLVLVEARLEQPVGPEGEPVLDRRVVRVAEVAREDVALDADRAHAVEDVLPRRLAAVRRAQAALEQAAALGERDLVLDREVLARELGVRDDDVARRPPRTPRRRRRTCRRGRGAPVARISPWRAIARSTSRVSGSSRPSASVTCTGSMLEPEPAQLVLEARPQRHLVAGLRLRAAGRLGRRVDGRHPDDPRALARRDLDRERVHPADRLVQGDRPDRLARRARARETICARSAVDV